ncbi:hypothetical protein EBR96_07515 [bacterium]|nr:hypothetical protein [bacterium]
MNYLIVGYYGFGNTGDDYLLSQTIRMIQTTDPACTIAVLYNRHATTPVPPKTQAIDRFSISAVSTAIRMSDRIIFGGGGLLQDQTSLKSLLYYCGIIFFGRFKKKTIILLGQGFSRPRRQLSRWLIGIALKCCTWIGCRDQDSFTYAASLTKKTSTVHLTGDLALIGHQLAFHAKRNTAIGLSVRPTPNPTTPAIAEWAAVSWLPIVGIWMEPGSDEDCLALIQESAVKTNTKFRFNTIHTLSGKFETIGSELPPISLMIGMRYHACIWAALNTIPFLALAYDDKVLSLAIELGQPYINTRRSFTANDIERALAQIQMEYDRYQRLLIDRVPALIRRAELNFDGLSPLTKFRN